MAQAVLASAAISALVLPLEVGDRIGTDGGWVRNYPLGYAYERPEVRLIVGFRYVPRYPVLGAGALRAAIARLRRYSKLPAARTLIAELEEAVDREERGLPAHIVDIFSRLSRVAIIRNTQLEELVADWREQSVRELQSLRDDVRDLVGDGAGRRWLRRSRSASAGRGSRSATTGSCPGSPSTARRTGSTSIRASATRSRGRRKRSAS